MSWEDTKLASVLKVHHGFAFKSTYFGAPSQHIVVTPGNFKEAGGFKRIQGKEKYYSGPIDEKYVLRPDSLIIAMTEQSEGLLGSSAMVPNDAIYLHNQRIGLIDCDKSLTDMGFLYHIFNSKPVRSQIRAKATGSKIRHTSPTSIGEVEISLPPLPIQKRIAGILSAYDDLIAVNERRIAILEEMARRVFEELLSSSEQSIKYGAYLVSSLGGDWGLENQDDEYSQPVKVVRGTDFPSLQNGSPNSSPTRFIKKASLLKRVLKPFDLIIENSINAKTRAAGTPLLITEDMLSVLGLDSIAASFCKVFRFKDKEQAIVAYHHLRHLKENGKMEEYQTVAANGIANFQSTSFQERCPFPDISSNDSEKQKTLTSALMSSSLNNLARQNTNLRATRDLLLPRLISGEIDVSQMPEAADTLLAAE